MTLDRRLIAILALVLAAIFFLALNIASTVFFRAARLDLTDNQLYTLADGTREILFSLEEPITLRFFFSSKVAASYPTIRSYAERVRDLIGEYQALSGGKLIVEESDPEPFSEDEDRAVALGIKPGPTEDGQTIYFGLVATNTVDGKEVIGFFDQSREEFLEYDLTSMIARLNERKKPVLGLVTNLPLDTGPGGLMAAMQGQSQPFMIYYELVNSFEIEFLEQKFDTVPDNVSALMIAHPKTLDQKTLYAIDQFVMKGGRVIVYVDPMSEMSQIPGSTGEPLQGATITSDLPELFKSWGVSYDPHIIVADRGRARRVQYGRAGQAADYVLWLSLQKSDLAKDDLVTSALDAISLATPGALRPIEGATTQFTPLITSSEDATEISVEEAQADSDPASLLARFMPTGEKYVFAARVSGPVKSAFPDGPPKEAKPGDAEEGGPGELENPEAEKPEGAASDKPAEHLAQSKGPVNILIVADSDLFQDKFWVEAREFMGERVAVPTSGNGAMIINAAENMLGSNALISLRARQSSLRPFTAVNALRAKAEARFLAEQKELERRLEDTQRRLDELQRAAQPGGQQGVLSPEQEAEIERFRGEIVETRKGLREVQRNLRRDIDRLDTALQLVNIVLMPVTVLGIALALAAWRAAARRARAARTGT
ncbi:MAG: Gldg family protein [Alphaproteobacteria bacterium]|nr:Gldg family protein [Alphaproteobacteria bacterium]